jgi:hemoglobin-like flavoprotein
VDKKILQLFEDSLDRCNADSEFLDRFYETFLASDAKVREKFKNTDFDRQKKALRESLDFMLLAATDEDTGPQRHLKDLAILHSRSKLDVGAEYYDLWLDSLLATAKETDPQYSDEIGDAWEKVMMVGVSYLLSHYNHPPE